ncbi:BTB/POZ domain-containing protein 3 [Magnaporthiopsis poae ATCC 64411]|uniref:BTB/POZ domain-containing protein 3 n=1 Tax=Magnaporthiopsis poae (strain ATCC 64411 / 73-15) TaxID=644358 RepID=A0A0C4DRJ7_MAGP6|nr:BTB/POZ domain-containing protein 3 [Magnaporthiopsis poae ATCC 64411]
MVVAKHELEAKLREENNLVGSGLLREENPLDLSGAFNDFLEACRRGDLKTCQELLSAGVNINGRDEFDYTPLILASLCGHFDLVRFLLESGATAERNTFQGERAVYNALNDKIRKLLIQYDYSKSTDPLQPWSSHITSLLSLTIPQMSDITLSGGGGLAPTVKFELHKFILAARTPYFAKKLADAPGTETWKLPSSLPIEATRAVIRYLYLDELPSEFASSSTGSVTEEDIFKGIDKISRSLEVGHIWDAVLASSNRRLARQRYQDEVQRAQAQVESFFHDNIIAKKIVVDAGAAQDVKWPRDNPTYADCLLQADECELEDDNANTVRANGAGILAEAKSPGARPRRAILYPVHKAMLIRSPYFQKMFAGPFLEAQSTEHLRIVRVDCVPEVLEVVLSFLYTEKADCSLELALDLLYTADMLLLDKLKSRAVALISALGSGSSNPMVAGKPKQNMSATAETPEAESINIYDVIRAAWDLRVQRLEEFAARYISARLEHYIDEPEFAEMIQESASRIKDREDTDTIELLDDIRFYLSERFRLRFEDTGFDMVEQDQAPQPPGGDHVPADGDAPGEATSLEGAHIGAVSAVNPDDASNGIKGASTQQSAPPPLSSSWVRTLDGTLVEDEFEADAANYQILLQKIDDLLDRLKLDA